MEKTKNAISFFLFARARLIAFFISDVDITIYYIDVHKERDVDLFFNLSCVFIIWMQV